MGLSKDLFNVAIDEINKYLSIPFSDDAPAYTIRSMEPCRVEQVPHLASQNTAYYRHVVNLRYSRQRLSKAYLASNQRSFHSLLPNQFSYLPCPRLSSRVEKGVDQPFNHPSTRRSYEGLNHCNQRLIQYLSRSQLQPSDNSLAYHKALDAHTDETIYHDSKEVNRLVGHMFKRYY